jgi:SAM-dependent methyltransferase
MVEVMSSSPARYEGHAEWYDETFLPYVAIEDADVLEELLGPGDGSTCLDLACGTGRFVETLAAAGYCPIGIDLASDQLRIAKARTSSLIRGDVAHLPIRDRSVHAAVGLYFHTDVEDFAAVLVDLARCLARSGRFVYLGVHPCFVGAFVDRAFERDNGRLEFVPGYGRGGWSPAGSFGGTGLRRRVGFHHKTLTEFFSAFIVAGLHIERVLELAGGAPVLPRNIAVLATRR